MKRILATYFIVIVIFMISACKSSIEKESNIDIYSEYLSGIPSKLISVSPNLKFYLKKTVDVSEVSEDIFTITPKVKGTVTLQNNIISFVPKEKLKSNKVYRVTLHLSKLYKNIKTDLEDFIIDLKTKELLLLVSLESPKVYDKNYNYVNGELTASDVFETKKAQEILTAEYAGKIVPISFEFLEKEVPKIHFKVDSLKRSVEDEKLIIKWNGKIIKSESKGSKEIIVVGKSNFKVVDIQISNRNKQQIEISFSDPIKNIQNLKGLIRFVNTQKRKFTYKVDNNVVTIYPNLSFKNKVDIEIAKGIKNTDDYALKESFKKTLYFEQLKPNISFIKSGSILPNANNLKINFNAVNLRAVDVTIYKIYTNNILQFLQQNNLNEQEDLSYVGRPVSKYTINLSKRTLQLDKPNAFALNLADLVEVEEGAMYRVELSYKKEYSNYTCGGEKPTNTIVFGKKELNTKSYNKSTYDINYDEYYYEDEYNWNERKDPCKNSYYRYAKISTNILATNLGVIVKKGNDNAIFVAVTNILTTKPVADADVTLYNFQQQIVTFAKTNANGIANFTNYPDAFFVVVSQGKNTSYLKLNDGNALSMSNFDVSGEKMQKGIQGYIYGERGVWRPGDRMYLTFVLNDNSNPLPEKHPIKFELINPQGKIVNRKIKYKEKANIYTYNPKTNEDAITGNWEVRITVGGVTFNKILKIETIKPNRLKIKFNTTKKIVNSNSEITGNVEVKWLHGAVARGLKLDVNGKFSSTKTTFKGFKNYNFDDITRKFESEEFKVLKGNLNNEGITSFSVKPRLDSKAPGMLKAYFITKVYENGGDFSTDVFTQNVSPYTSYVGLNPAKEQQSKNYLFTDENYTFNVVSLNEKGNKIANNLEVSVYKLSWYWWWNTNDKGLSEYDGTNYKEPYTKRTIKTNTSGRGEFKLKINKNDWGRYLIKVKDKKSGHITSNIVYFDWPSWYGNKKGVQDKSNATMLVFSTDKEKYNIDETAKIKFPSAAGGRALITIENGVKVLDNFWVETKNKQTSFEFPILPKYAPNVFINISLLQKHSQTKNDLPIRMYGTVPILVSNPATKLNPELIMDEEMKPETTTSIKIKEKDGKPMVYTIALVDEGLLDLTRFKTPNPWNVFYARQSLGVKTWDIFDDVIGAYGGKINQILSIGGDEALVGSKNKKANRFKPVVEYIGPFKLEKGETKEHKVKIPKYVGSVRAMLVASNLEDEAYGSDEKVAFIRKPLMILASLPRKITPRETVILPVNVFAMKSHVKNVKVSLEPNEAYTIVDDETKEVSFNRPDEKMVYFELKINDFKGIAKVKINASSGNEKASYDIEINVFNPNPVTTETLDAVLKSNEKKTLEFAGFGTQGTNFANIELSTLPPINFTERLAYLIQYPHGCVEQTTSSAFPQLYFSDIFDLPLSKKIDIERNVKATIQQLSNFQMSNGGLSYWKGGSYADDWGTSYAGHFMIEASKKGYALPIGFKEKWIVYQKQEARNWKQNLTLYYNNDLEQAYRLYTLCLVNKPDLASMNRLREATDISNRAKIRLAAAYALIGKQSIAKIILKGLTADSTRNYYYNYGSKTRDEAMALETYTLLKDEINAIKLAKKVSEKLSSNQWMSTQTTAYSLMAISTYALKNKGNDGIDAKYYFNTEEKEVATSKALFTSDLKNIKKENTINITNRNNGTLYVRIFNKGVLPVGEEKIMQKNLEINIVYKNKAGNIILPSKINQGTNFIAEITIKNKTSKDVQNIALTQIIPSGWEIINTRFTDFGTNTKSSKVDFTDIRDDSVNYYFSLQKYQTKTFIVLLNASYLGNYYLPGIQAEAMYDSEYIVRTKGQWVEVKR